MLNLPLYVTVWSRRTLTILQKQHSRWIWQQKVASTPEALVRFVCQHMGEKLPEESGTGHPEEILSGLVTYILLYGKGQFVAPRTP